MDYLLKSSICMVAFYGLYFFGFRRLTFHALNRFYLLASLALSLTIPMLSYEHEEVVIIEPSPISEITYSEEKPTQSIDNQVLNVVPQIIEQHPIEINWIQVLTIIYLSGMAIMLFFFLRNIIIILKSLTSASLSDRFDQNGTTIILVQNSVTERIRSPQSNASFFNYIFLNPDNLNPNEQALIIAHESFHAKQLHTLDLLLISFLKAIFWFNPIIYFYQKSLKQIHEYEVDAIMSATHDSRAYAHLLLKLGVAPNSLTINQFSTKPLSDRIQFLFKTPTKNMKKLLYFLSIPIIGFGIVAFAQEKVKVIYQEKLGEKKAFSTSAQITVLPKTVSDTLIKKKAINNDLDKFSYQFGFPELKLDNIDSIKISVNNQLLVEGQDFILKGNEIFLDQKYKDSKAKIHIYSSGGGKILYPQLAKLEGIPLLKMNLTAKLPNFLASNDNKFLLKPIKIPFPNARPIKSQDTLRTMLETNKLGENPLVIINGEEYPSSILNRIDPTKIGWSYMAPPNNPKALEKYGKKAKDGFIEIRTTDDFIFKNEKSYQIAVENVKKQLQPSKSRVRRLILKDAEGKDIEQLSILRINTNEAQASITFPVGSTTLFILDGEIVSEEVVANSTQIFVSTSASSQLDKKSIEKYGDTLKQYDSYFSINTKRD